MLGKDQDSPLKLIINKVRIQKRPFFCIIIFCFSLNTFQRNSVWKVATSLWSDCVLKSPYKARPHNNLGSAYVIKGRLNRAISEYERALVIKPDYAMAHSNLALTYYLKENYRLAIIHCDIAVRLEGSVKPELLELLKPLR